MSDVARLNIKVSADTAAAMAQLAALDRQLKSMGGTSSSGITGAMRDMEQQSGRTARSAVDLGRAFDRARDLTDKTDRSVSNLAAHYKEVDRSQRDMNKSLAEMNKLFDNARDLTDKTDRTVMSIAQHHRDLEIAQRAVTNSTNESNRRWRDHDSVLGRSILSILAMNASLRGLADRGDNANFRMRSLLITMAMFGVVALAPMITDAVGALGALAATATTAGLAFGAFFLAVMPQITNVKRGWELWQRTLETTGKAHETALANFEKFYGNLSATEKKLFEAFKNMRQEFDDWAEAMAQFTAPALMAWFSIITNNLTTLNPLVAVGANLFQRMGQAIDNFMQSSEWQKMVASFADAAQNILPSFGRALGNFIVGFLNLMLAFTPLAGDMNGGLENMSIQFRNWSETLKTNTGFQNFVNYVRENGPKMVNILGQLIEGVSRFVFALSPLGTWVAQGIANLVEQIGRLSPSQIGMITAAILALAAGFQILRIAALLGWSSVFAPLIPIVAAIGLVVGAFFLLWNASEDLRNAFNQHVAPALRNLWNAIQELWGPISTIAGAFLRWAGDMLAKFMPAIEVVLNGLAGFFRWMSDNLEVLVSIWSDKHMSMSEKMKETWEFIKLRLQDAWENHIKPALKQALDWVLDRIVEFKDKALDWWDKHHDEVISAINDFWNNRVIPFIKTKINEIVDWLSTEGKNILANAMKEAWDLVGERVKEALFQLAKDIPKYVGALSLAVLEIGKNLVQGLFKGAVDEIASSLPGWVKGWGSNIIKGVKDFFGIHSPSTVFAEFGGHMIQGLLNGLFGGPDIGKMIGTIFGVSGDPLQWLVSHIDDVGIALVKKIPELATVLAKAAPALLSKLAPLGGEVLKSIGSVFGSFVGGGSANSEQLNAWILAAMGLTGVGTDWFAPLSVLINRESGGNPNAINLTDSNAAQGYDMASKGLAQTIGPTFRAYHQAGTSDNIFDPIANIAAAINYIKARYGTIFAVQQANESLPPAGYALGTSYATPGPHMVAENGPELVFSGGEKVLTASRTRDMLNGNQGNVYNFDFRGATFSGSSRDFEDMVRTALTNLERDGRM